MRCIATGIPNQAWGDVDAQSCAARLRGAVADYTWLPARPLFLPLRQFENHAGPEAFGVVLHEAFVEREDLPPLGAAAAL